MHTKYRHTPQQNPFISIINLQFSIAIFMHFIYIKRTLNVSQTMLNALIRITSNIAISNFIAFCYSDQSTTHIYAFSHYIFSQLLTCSSFKCKLKTNTYKIAGFTRQKSFIPNFNRLIKSSSKYLQKS